MGRPERPLPHEPKPAGRLARDRIDFGGHGAFFQAHGRKDSRQGFGQGAFPGSRRAYQNGIVVACAGNFQSSFGPLLPHNVGKVHVIGLIAAGTGGQRILVKVRVPDQEVRGILPLLQDKQDVIQVSNPENLRLRVIHSLQGRCLRQDATLEPLPDGQLHHREGPADSPDAAVQAQFPHNQVLPQSGQLPLPGGGNDPQGDGQVVPAALLVHVGRSQVDDNFLSGNVKSLSLQGRDGPQQAFFHGGVGQPHQVDADPQGDFNLDNNGYGLYTHTFGPMYIYQHFVSCLWAQATTIPAKTQFETEKLSGMFQPIPVNFFGFGKKPTRCRTWRHKRPPPGRVFPSPPGAGGTWQRPFPRSRSSGLLSSFPQVGPGCP